MATLDAASAANGTDTDGTIDVQDIAGLGGYKFEGSESGLAGIGYAISSGGNADGDTLSDILIGARFADGDGAAYLFNAKDLAALDAADFSTDGVIRVESLESASNLGSGYAFSSGPQAGNGSDFGSFGSALSDLGDIDGDGLSDYLVGDPNYQDGASDRGASYILYSSELSAADARDGADGRIDVNASISANVGGYRILGSTNASSGSQLGADIENIGDLDGDGKNDILIGSPNTFAEGEAYLVLSKNLQLLADDDGSAGNRTITIANTSDTYKYTFTSNNSSKDDFGNRVAGAGDVDGDGRVDLLIGRIFSDENATTSGSAYLVFGGGLTGNGGAINVDDAVAAGTAYQFQGEVSDSRAGSSISSAGDMDGDGKSDLIIGAEVADGGTVYLVTSAALEQLDNQDLVDDNQIDLANVAGVQGSYKIVNDLNTGGRLGSEVTTAGDIDGDGITDFLISAELENGTLPNTSASSVGSSYLVLGSQLDAIDAADGNTDGVISLSQIPGSVTTAQMVVDVDSNGDGTILQGGTTQVSSVENYIAGENAGEVDVITIGDANPVFDGSIDPGGVFFNRYEISDLDDNAVGTFTPLGGGAPIAFGPTEANQLSDVLALAVAGNIQITGGDESGTVGGVTFSNFETINFGVTCFARGTLIDTADGEVPVESLSIGDKVKTMDDGCQEIRWIGSRKLSAATLQANPKLKPIRIQAGSLGYNLPREDLLVSPQHRVFLRNQIAARMFGRNEVLVAANKLLSLPGIDVEQDADGVEYFHILLDEHQVIWSNGAPTESLFNGPEMRRTLSDECREEIETLFPKIFDLRINPRSARFIPETGKEARRLAERLAKNDKHAISAAF